MDDKNRKLGAWALRHHASKKHEARTKIKDDAGLSHDLASIAADHTLLRRITLIGLPLICFILVWLLTSPSLVTFNIAGSTVPARISNAELQKIITQKTSQQKLFLRYPDKSQKAFTLPQVGVNPDPVQTVDTLRQTQHSLRTRLQWWQPIYAVIETDVHPPALHAFINDHARVTAQPAQDATLTIENGTVKIINPISGKEYGLSDPAWTIIKAVSRGQAEPLKLQTLAVAPVITSEQLARSKTQLEKVLHQHIVFTIDNKTVTATKQDIAAWLELSPNQKSKSVDIAVNSGKVQDYINKIAASHIHPARAEVVMVHDDGTKEVLVAGTNGIDIINKQEVATNVSNNLLAAKGMNVSLPIRYANYKTITAGNYDKWLAVDITNKRMYAYEKSTLIKTFLVSAGAPATPTVTGTFAIYSKRTQQTMTGENADGTNYRQPNVPWVNYFYKDYAIHGNYWRPLSYFGNINSSHGCVGTTVSDGQWIYTWAPIGTPVIVHT